MFEWNPQPKQGAFMSRWEYEALYGGSAGSGKSDTLLAEALRQISIPHYKGLLLRKTYKQLEELIDRSREMYRGASPSARYNGAEHAWTFPSGAKIYFGNMQYTSDRINYQGKRYDYIAFDELTHFTRDEYIYLVSRNRPNGTGTRVYMRAATNPGGIGHMWVKQRFVDAGPPLKTIWEEYDDVDESGLLVKRKISRIFVPAKLSDNKKLTDADPTYRRRLLMLPEAERKALLDGSWDVFTGQVFAEWINRPRYTDANGRERPTTLKTHVVEHISDIPSNWRIYQGFDWGFSKPFSVHWYAVDNDARMWCFKEYYGCTGTPDVGLRLDVATLGREIKRIEAEDERIRSRKITRIADPAIYKEDGGESMAQVFDRMGLYFERGDHNRIPGWQQIHRRLTFDAYGKPMLYITEDCPNLIRTLPALVYDESKPEDVDTKQEDHAGDELRYVCMANPLKAAPIPEPRPAFRPDPLNLGLNRRR